MEKNQWIRTELLLGEAAMDKLAASRVAVFGIGGVGGFVCEGLVRSGIGAFDLIDNDTVAPSNLNRQIIALKSTLGRYKTEVMKERMLDINPSAEVTVHNCFYLPEQAEEFDFSRYDYVVDAVDTVTAKLSIILRAKEAGVPVISAMGAGNKLDSTAFRVADIYETKVCPLAKVMRRELKKRGVESLKVVYSEEKAIALPALDEIRRGVDGQNPEDECQMQQAGQLTEQVSERPKKALVGSISFVPSVAGLIIAGEVVKDLASSLESQANGS